MLSGSAFLRVIVLLVAAAVLAGVVQHYLAQPGESTESSRAEATRPPASAPAATREPPAREPPAKEPPAASPSPSPAPLRADPEPAPAVPPDAAQTMPPDEAPDGPQDQAAAPAPGGSSDGAGEAATAEETTGELVDLNTGTLAQLNGLRGGGAIGRAIIQRRPYSSVDQLLSKRVLNRSTYQRIKDQVTVR